MNTLPCAIKSLITDFIFNKSETYAQRLPAKAIEEAKNDLNDVTALRVLCNGDCNFLGTRFKVTQAVDVDACAQARRNLVSAILKCRHCHVKWFEMPKLKTDRLCMTRFVERNLHHFTAETFLKHTGVIEALSEKITALRLKQRVLLRLAKRASSHWHHGKYWI